MFVGIATSDMISLLDALSFSELPKIWKVLSILAIFDLGRLFFRKNGYFRLNCRSLTEVIVSIASPTNVVPIEIVGSLRLPKFWAVSAILAVLT